MLYACTLVNVTAASGFHSACNKVEAAKWHAATRKLPLGCCCQATKQPSKLQQQCFLSCRAAVLLLLVHDAPPRLGRQQLLQPRNDLALRMRRGWSEEGLEKMHTPQASTREAQHKPAHACITPTPQPKLNTTNSCQRQSTPTSSASPQCLRQGHWDHPPPCAATSMTKQNKC